MTKMNSIDIELSRVLELIDYCQETGSFTWKPKPAGHKRKDSGYISITIDGNEIKAHRLAWFITHGEWPSSVIDHINGDPSDNRISNLRDATHKINAENKRKHHKDSASKMLGVCWHKHRSRWQAHLGHNGKTIYLGLHDTPEAAHEAYLSAKRKIHEGCTI